MGEVVVETEERLFGVRLHTQILRVKAARHDVSYFLKFDTRVGYNCPSLCFYLASRETWYVN